MATKKKTNSSSSTWTQEEEALLFELRSFQCLPFSIIAREVGRSENACSKKFYRTQWNTKAFYDPAKCRLKENFKQALRQKVADAVERKRETNKYANDILVDHLIETVKALPEVKKEVYKFSSKRAKQKHSSEDVGLILSDTHIGHHHTLEETGGISEYNFDIFKKRVDFIKKATAEIVELHSQLYPLPNLHIFCPGDIVAGMNSVGNWSPTYINMPILDQAIAGTDAFADMINYWLGLFDNIYFYGVYGNHGRGARAGVEKEYVNWDYISYKFLEARFAENKRVKFEIPKSWWLFKKIRQHKFMMFHGDCIRGGSKGIEDATEKMASIIKEIPDYTLAGHFHSATEISTNFGRVILNGSFIGSDVYSLKELRRASRPEQKIFGIHDKRGITWTYNLDLSVAR